MEIIGFVLKSGRKGIIFEKQKKMFDAICGILFWFFTNC